MQKSTKNFYTPAFETFYKHYPRPIGKFEASRAFNKLNVKEKHLLNKAMPAVIEHYKFTEKQFIPYPSTFLNQRRWEDYLDGDNGRNKADADPFLRHLRESHKRS